MNTDVIIVGAGPTGLALAAQLIRYGIDFVIFDKKETTTPFSKAIGVQARTLIFGANQTFSILLRPDNYIGLISADTSQNILEDYLSGKFGLNLRT